MRPRFVANKGEGLLFWFAIKEKLEEEEEEKGKDDAGVSHNTFKFAKRIFYRKILLTCHLINEIIDKIFIFFYSVSNFRK